jgi:hypothetical protein
MAVMTSESRLVHRTARIRVRATRRQTDRCYGLLRSAGDVWAWLLNTNHERLRQGLTPVAKYQALCRELTVVGTFGELSVAGARSVARRYSDAWFQAAKRRRDGTAAGFPRRRRALVPVRFHHGTFLLRGRRLRLAVARGQPELWLRLARPIPYPPEQVRAITLLAGGGRLWLSVTAAVPVEVHDLNAELVGRSDLRTIFTCGTSRPAATRPPADRPRPGNGDHAAGADFDTGCGKPRPGIAAASIRPIIERPSRWSPSPFNIGSVPSWWAIPGASPLGMWAGRRISGCGNGGVPTSSEHCATRRSAPGSRSGWWTSGALPPPARHADDG